MTCSSDGRGSDTRVSINVEIQHGTSPADRARMGAPPTYDDAMRYDHVTGSVNWVSLKAIQSSYSAHYAHTACRVHCNQRLAGENYIKVLHFPS